MIGAERLDKGEVKPRQAQNFVLLRPTRSDSLQKNTTALHCSCFKVCLAFRTSSLVAREEDQEGGSDG